MDTPEFLSSTLHIITFFAVPLHILGTYCILAKTPKSMSSVKWVMFNFHFWCMILDWSLTILTIPFLLFPALAGFPLGVLNEFGVSVAIQVYLIVTLLGVIQTSIIQIFENRFFILFGTKTKWKNYRKLFIACTYIASVTFFIPAVLLVPDQTIGMQIVFEILPDLPHEIRKMPIYVFAIEFRFVVVPVAIMAVSHTIEWYIFFKLISTNMKLSIKTMVHSKNTIGLQKRFIKAMTVQSAAFLLNLQIPVLYMFVCVVALFNVPDQTIAVKHIHEIIPNLSPTISDDKIFVLALEFTYVVVPVCMGPVIYGIISQFTGYYNQAFNNLSFIFLSIHGVSSTSVMLYLHKPYREYCGQVIGMAKKTMPQRSVVSVVLSSQ
ncbi:unnamed protein product [Caenorhabditis brenneri]